MTLPDCPAALFAQLQTCLRADGAKVPSKLMDVLATLASRVDHVAQSDLAWVEARQLLAGIGRGLSMSSPQWHARIDSDDAQAPWGGIWLGVSAGEWQLWQRTPQQGWEIVYGNPAATLPAQDAPGFFLTKLVEPVALDGEDKEASPTYWRWVVSLLRGRIGTIMLASVIINLGLLTLPLFAMLVYDKVVFNGIFETLWALAIGVGLVLALEIAVRALRARQVERLSQALDERIDSRLFSVLLRPSVRAGSQPGMTARFLTLYRDLAGARDFFSSHYLLAIADLPFVLLLWLVIGVVAWPLLIVILVWTALYTWCGSVLKHRMLRAGQHAIKSQLAKQAVLTDALSSLDLLRTSHAGGKMFGRFMALAREQSLHVALQREEANRGVWLSQIVYAGCYVTLLIAGAYLVFNQQLTTGALIAVSMLSGRSLGIVGQVLTTLGRWQELRQALRALAPFMDADDDKQTVVASRSAAEVAGRILVHRVGHAYPDMQPSLQDVQ
jgi:ABC-type bacteriocin/lantibiotic exporter with double-glycine peptidase domain